MSGTLTVGQDFTIDGPDGTDANGNPVPGPFDYAEVDIPGPTGEGGVLTVENDGTLNVSGTAYVGDTTFTGGGVLAILSGSDATIGTVQVGNGGGSIGTVSVSDAGSLLDVTGDVVFNSAGDSLDVQAGATAVIAGNLTESASDYQGGDTKVDGAGTNLSIGGNMMLGAGTLAVSGGAHASAGQTLSSLGTVMVTDASGGASGASVLSAKVLDLAGFGLLDASDGGTAIFATATIGDAAILDASGDGGAGGDIVIGADPNQAQAGAIVVESGAILSAMGSDPYAPATLLGAIVDDGVIQAGSMLYSGALPLLLDGPVTGNGTLAIGFGGGVELAGPLAAGIVIDFAGAGTLALAAPAATISNRIAGFGSGDTIEVPGTKVISYAATATGLSITTDMGTYDFTGLAGAAGLTGPGAPAPYVPGEPPLVGLTLYAADSFQTILTGPGGSYDWSTPVNWSNGAPPVPNAEVVDSDTTPGGVDDLAGTPLGILDLENGAQLAVTVATDIGTLNLSAGSVLLDEAAGLAVSIGQITGAGATVGASAGTLAILGGSDPGETYTVGEAFGVPSEVFLAQTPSNASTFAYSGLGTFALANPNTQPGGPQLTGIVAGDVLELPGFIESATLFAGALTVQDSLPNGFDTLLFGASYAANVNAVAIGFDPATGLNTLTFEAQDSFQANVAAATGPFAGDYLWSSFGNWSNGIPDSQSSVLIQNTAGAAVLDDIAGLTIQALTVASATLLDVSTSLTLGNAQVSADITGAGSITVLGTLAEPDNTGAVTIDPAVTNDGTILGGAGDTLTLAGPFTNDGMVTGNVIDPIVVEGPVSGTGNFLIGDGDEFTFASVVGAGQTITFAPGSGTLMIDDPAGFAASIAGFSQGASILFAPGSASGAAIVGNTLVVSEPGGGSTTIQLSGDFAGATIGTDAAGGISVVVPCFLAGTPVATTRGEIPVEDLRPGDVAVTLEGDCLALQPIIWTGSTRFDARSHPNPSQVWPIRIRAGALADNVPYRDLLVSPGHALRFGGALVQAERLVNGASIIQDRGIARGDYFHVELPRHGILLGAGAACESYLDTGNRAAFEPDRRLLTLFPDLSPKHWTETCLPLAQAGATLTAIRTGLLARAQGAGYRIGSDPGLAVAAEGHIVLPQVMAPRTYRFRLPTAASQARLVSRTWVPGEIEPDSRDMRALGVCVRRMTFDGEALRLDDPRLTDGWHQFEGDQVESWRWTMGDAWLPVGRREVTLELCGASTYWEHHAPAQRQVA